MDRHISDLLTLQFKHSYINIEHLNMCVTLQCSCQNKFADATPCLLLTRFNIDDYMHTLTEFCGLYALLYTTLTKLCEIHRFYAVLYICLQ